MLTALTLAGPALADQSFNFKLIHQQLPGPMQTLRLQQGERLQINWQSDEALTLHLHGYDQILKLSAGQSASMKLLLDRSGRFSISTHTTHTDDAAVSSASAPQPTSGKHGHGKRPLLYLEVLPR